MIVLQYNPVCDGTAANVFHICETEQTIPFKLPDAIGGQQSSKDEIDVRIHGPRIIEHLELIR